MIKVYKRKLYNPNSFNALDAAIAFIVILIVLTLTDVTVGLIVSAVKRNVEEFDYFLFSCISGLITQGLILLIAFVFCKTRKVSVFSGGGFVYKFDIVQILFALLLGSGIYFVFMHAHFDFIEDLYPILYGISFDEYSQAVSKSMQGSFGLALLDIYVLTPLLPCVCEEAFFRGVMMRGLKQFGATTAVILSSLCFAFMHGNISQLVLQFSIGLAIGSVVMITGNFLLGAAMHFANNLFSSLFEVFSSTYGNTAFDGEYLADALFIVIGLVFMIVGGYYFIRLAVSSSVKKATGKPIEIPLKDADNYALVRRSGEEQQKIYPVQVDTNVLNDGSFFFENGGREYMINKRSGKVASITLLTLGIIISVVLIFVL